MGAAPDTSPTRTLPPRPESPDPPWHPGRPVEVSDTSGHPNSNDGSPPASSFRGWPCTTVRREPSSTRNVEQWFHDPSAVSSGSVCTGTSRPSASRVFTGKAGSTEMSSMSR